MQGTLASQTKEIKLYVTTYCPYCVSAKQLLTTLGLKFSEINLDSDPDLRTRLSQENNGWRTVPMIFIGNQFIGGFTDLKALHDTGKLKEMLG
jgi:glutaredoxin 3